MHHFPLTTDETTLATSCHVCGGYECRADYCRIYGTRKTKPSDPAYKLIEAPHIHSTPNPGIYRDSCYICRDPEYAMMGLPLCQPCVFCKVGHVAAGDCVCDDCGRDQRDNDGDNDNDGDDTHEQTTT